MWINILKTVLLLVFTYMCFKVGTNIMYQPSDVKFLGGLAFFAAPFLVLLYLVLKQLQRKEKNEDEGK